MQLRSLLLVILVGLTSMSSVYAQDLSTSAPSTALPAAGCPDGCVAAEDEADPADWYKRLGLGFSYTDGNANTSDLNITGAINRDYENNIWDFSFAYSYGEGDQNETEGGRCVTSARLSFRPPPGVVVA